MGVLEEAREVEAIAEEVGQGRASFVFSALQFDSMLLLHRIKYFNPYFVNPCYTSRGSIHTIGV